MYVVCPVGVGKVLKLLSLPIIYDNEEEEKRFRFAGCVFGAAMLERFSLVNVLGKCQTFVLLLDVLTKEMPKPRNRELHFTGDKLSDRLRP